MADWTKTNERLDRFVRREMKRTGVPGVSVGILKGARRHTNGYGVTNVDHPLEVDDDTLFQIGSTTKTYTATAAMRLVQQGKLDLDAPVRRYLKDLRLKNKEAEQKATLLHLFTHTGGWLGDYFTDEGRGEEALAKAVGGMSKVKHLTPLGEVWSYNNAGFYIAGRIIEKVTKQPYETAIRELLLEPLGMESSFFFAEEVMTYRVAVGHVTNRTKPQVARPWALARTANPAGGIISGVKDQLTWAAFHMGDGKSAAGKRVLRKSLLQKMQKPHAPAGSIADSVGISWLLRTVDGEKLVAHGGTTIGQLSAFLMVPERRFAITVLTNSTRGGELHRSVVDWALENYLGITRSDKPALKVPKEDLLEYQGQYRIEASGQLFDVEARNGALVVKLPTPPAGPDGRKPPKIPPIRLRFVEPDKIAATSGALKGTGGEFLRGSRDRIKWFRFGGRIHRRVDPSTSKR